MAPILTNRSLSLNYTLPALLAQKPMALLSNYTPQSTNPQNESKDNNIDAPFLLPGVVFFIIVFLLIMFGILIYIEMAQEEREEEERAMRKVMYAEMRYAEEKDSSIHTELSS
ncbi:hypothetical protein HYALB_00005124 [Hymenoscyphus albidus]|uniref:Uncharacterized protein n=1 Tax=Hymenoscyphus albidus TaxID=595503 RepID=A0A9N9LZH7_9HELO|nr:hypothetical protein HYALB_00005124 [Hymenoscyphus albidus]